MIILILILILFLLWIIIGNIYYAIKHPKITFDLYFGVPGSGKSTIAAWIVNKCLKKKTKACCNVPIKGAYEVVKDDIGKYLIKDCDLLIDEAGIDYNNRHFNKFSDLETYFYKYHRHYKVNISMFSQDLDMDVKLRKLATRIFLVKKSILPGFVYRREIEKYIGIDEQTHQIVDMYRFKFLLFGIKYIYCPKLWKMFDSYSYKELPKKDFLKY